MARFATLSEPKAVLAWSALVAFLVIVLLAGVTQREVGGWPYALGLLAFVGGIAAREDSIPMLALIGLCIFSMLDIVLRVGILGPV
ncbi:MAG TPA: hypothetical protein VM889_12215 [Candidatus Thermoplasmatota archaeon]|nr:hypothetical protein [Candidatus Thermoplasmatota archaeon]